MRRPAEYLEASRRTLLLLSAAPVCLGCAVLFFAIWPSRLAAGHVAVLTLLSLTLVDAFLLRFRKIPFTCSYLPGKSHFHMMFLCGMGLLMVSSWFAEYELKAMERPLAFTGFLALLTLLAVALRWWVNAAALDEEAPVQFEDVMPPAVQTLGLTRDGVTPLPGARIECCLRFRFPRKRRSWSKLRGPEVTKDVLFGPIRHPSR
jgi:hypothetical protein